MRTVLIHAAGVLSAGLLASAALAADVRPVAAPAGPEVHRMVILNGPTQTVHYFSVGLSTSDQAALRDLESAENNADYAADLQSLRRQYVAEELALAPHRSSVQQSLYGQSITQAVDYQAAGGLNYGPGYYGGAGYYPGYSYGGYGYGYGYGYGANTAFAGSASTINQSLAHGVGDEGSLKTAMAAVIASQANAEFATSAAHAYTAAYNRAGESDAMRTALGINKRGVVTAADEQPRHVTLMLKAGAGDKVDGVIVDENADWITVETAADEVSVRRADVTRIERHKK